MMTKQTYRNDCIILKTIDEIVPKNQNSIRDLDITFLCQIRFFLSKCYYIKKNWNLSR